MLAAGSLFRLDLTWVEDTSFVVDSTCLSYIVVDAVSGSAKVVAVLGSDSLLLDFVGVLVVVGVSSFVTLKRAWKKKKDDEIYIHCP